MLIETRSYLAEIRSTDSLYVVTIIFREDVIVVGMYRIAAVAPTTHIRCTICDGKRNEFSSNRSDNDRELCRRARVLTSLASPRACEIFKCVRTMWYE